MSKDVGYYPWEDEESIRKELARPDVRGYGCMVDLTETELARHMELLRYPTIHEFRQQDTFIHSMVRGSTIYELLRGYAHAGFNQHDALAASLCYAPRSQNAFTLFRAEQNLNRWCQHTLQDNEVISTTWSLSSALHLLESPVWGRRDEQAGLLIFDVRPGVPYIWVNQDIQQPRLLWEREFLVTLKACKYEVTEETTDIPLQLGYRAAPYPSGSAHTR